MSRLLLSLAALAFPATAASADPPAKTPNVILIVADDKDESKCQLMCDALNRLEIVGESDLGRSERIWDLG
jgi:hypothetical protein